MWVSHFSRFWEKWERREKDFGERRMKTLIAIMFLSVLLYAVMLYARRGRSSNLNPRTSHYENF
jgi:hypothetical protein